MTTPVVAKGTFGADNAPHAWLLRFHRLIDRLLFYAYFLRVDQSIERPLDEIEPLFVALPDDGTKGFL